MAPPNACKLTYFDAKGAAEQIRYLLHYGKYQFEDIRLDFAKWSEIKNTMPMLKLPMLEFEGHRLYQSLAICRFLAWKMDLVGNNYLETWHIDAIADTMADLRTMVGTYALRTPEADKPKKKQELLNQSLPDFLSRLDKIVEDNKGYFSKGKLSYADLVFAATEEVMSSVMETDLLEKFPNLRALKTKVENLPGIKEWVARRPKTLL